MVRGRVPSAEGQVAATTSGFESALVGLPVGPVHVVKASVDHRGAALRPRTAEQEKLFRRYNPLRADDERWLEGVPPDATRSGRFLGRFRRG